MKEYNRNNVSLAKELRKNQTKWENDLWYKFLRKYPVRFQRQKPIDNYIVDFYCAKAKLIIELDGYYHTTDAQLIYDKKRTEQLEEKNFNVLRFSNADIENDFEKVCKQIDFVVKNLVSKNL